MLYFVYNNACYVFELNAISQFLCTFIIFVTHHQKNEYVIPTLKESFQVRVSSKYSSMIYINHPYISDTTTYVYSGFKIILPDIFFYLLCWLPHQPIQGRPKI